jgi:hypothetical protein
MQDPLPSGPTTERPSVPGRTPSGLHVLKGRLVPLCDQQPERQSISLLLGRKGSSGADPIDPTPRFPRWRSFARRVLTARSPDLAVLGSALVVAGVDLDVVLPLVWQLVLGEARVHGTRLDAGVAVDALLGVEDPWFRCKAPRSHTPCADSPDTIDRQQPPGALVVQPRLKSSDTALPAGPPPRGRRRGVIAKRQHAIVEHATHVD